MKRSTQSAQQLGGQVGRGHHRARSPTWGSTSSYSSSFAPKKNNLAVDAGLFCQAPSWVPDALAPRCYRCQKEFGLFGWNTTRRHHCRSCGNCFCSPCSTNRIELIGSDQAVRVCDKCFENLSNALRVQKMGGNEQTDSETPRLHGHYQQQHSCDGTSSLSSSEEQVRSARNDLAKLNRADSTDSFDSNSLAVGISTPNSTPDAPSRGPDIFEKPPETLSSTVPMSVPPILLADSNSVDLLNGELILGTYDDVHFEYTCGQVVMTNFQLILTSMRQGDKLMEPVHIPVMSIERFEIEFNEEYDAGMINVFCKNFRFVRLAVFDMIARQRFTEFHQLETSLVNLTFPRSKASFADRFAFISAQPLPSSKPREQLLRELGVFSGCCLSGRHYEDLSEIQRLFGDSLEWRISRANASFALCDSYPRYLVVPTRITDAELHDVARFRCRRRFPIVSWLDKDSGLVLARASQPKVGLLRGRSLADEKLIAAIAMSGRSSASQKQQRGLVIIDARPIVNATFNKVTSSGGFEDIASYNETLRSQGGEDDLISIEFMDVENTTNVRASVHRVRKLIGYKLKKPPRYPNHAAGSSSHSGAKASGSSAAPGGAAKPKKQSFASAFSLPRSRQASNWKSSRKILRPDASVEVDEDDQEFEIGWIRKFSDSRWLELLAYIIKATARVVRILKIDYKSVLVHCSDGWDRTSQLTSLSMLCMDGHYRTLEGFITLVEKEWLSAGHPFMRRTGTGKPAVTNSTKRSFTHDSSHLSSIFLQFIDCVYQFMHQFPQAFQFNEALLILVLDRLYDARHGNFLVDCRRETYERNLLQRSTCLWEEVMTRRHQFMNPSYGLSTASQVLLPAFSTKILQFWQGYYLRFDDSCVDFDFEPSRASRQDAEIPAPRYSSTKPCNISKEGRMLRRASSSLHFHPAPPAAPCASALATRLDLETEASDHKDGLTTTKSGEIAEGSPPSLHLAKTPLDTMSTSADC